MAPRDYFVSPFHGFRSAAGQSALFLGRDLLLAHDGRSGHYAEGTRLRRGAADVVLWANSCAIPAIIVAHQPGIDCGLFGWRKFHAANAALHQQLASYSAHVDAVAAYTAPPGGEAVPAKRCPGNLKAASAKFDIDLSASWLAADKHSEMRLAKDCGLAGAFQLCADDAPRMQSRSNATFPTIRLSALHQIMPLLESCYSPSGLSRERRNGDAAWSSA